MNSKQLTVPTDWEDLKTNNSNPKMRAPRVSASRMKGKPALRRPKPGWRRITAGDAADYGAKAWQLAKHLATLINVENKTWDVDGSAGTIVTSTPLVVNLTNIAQGADYNNRDGDSILGQSIEFRASVAGNSAGPRNSLRVLVVRDKLQRGVDPVLGDVLQAGTSPMVQPYLVPQINRFDIMYDEVIYLNTVGPELATAGTSTTYINKREKLPSLIRKWNSHVLYTGPTGADASNWTGALYLMAVSLDATNGPSLSYTFRLHFTDN